MKRWGSVLLFVVGLVVGATLALVGPRLAGPYLPGPLRGKLESVEGQVIRKQRDANRLLLTVTTSRGAILATFTRKVPEVDLLVGEGDELTMSLRRVEPFVEDPVIESVRKKTPAAPGPSGPLQRTP